MLAQLPEYLHHKVAQAVGHLRLLGELRGGRHVDAGVQDTGDPVQIPQVLFQLGQQVQGAQLRGGVAVLGGNLRARRPT